MASAITHFVVGASVGWAAMESDTLRSVLPRWAIPVTAGLWGVLPDLDTYAMLAFHIPRGSFFSHRGFFHSPFFLTLLPFTVAAPAVRGRAWVAPGALWAAAAITHPLPDMLTDGGNGVMLLYPFSEARLFFPWRPIRVSPLAIVRFFDRAGEILLSELPFCAGAAALGLTVRRAVRRRTPA